MTNFYKISEKRPELPKDIPMNRVIRSSFSTFERKEPSRGVSVKIPLQGVENYRLEGKPIRLKPGNYLVVNNQEEVEYALNSSKEIQGICIYLENGLINKACKDILSDDGTLLDLPETRSHPRELISGSFPLSHSRLEPIISGINFLQEGKIEDSFFYRLAYFLAAKSMDDRSRIKKLQTKKASTASEILQRLEVARAFILDNIQYELSIKEVADVALMSEYHFIRSFKKCFHQSPWQFILYHRILKAKSLLKEGSSTITEVAFSSGFSDIFSFSKAFKKHTGLSPSHYQNSF